ncbi:energy transducer TonB [Rhodanobacter denitrificans]|uniref:Energy transducer TonB n=1 Tax=Rhodanobacter denitrificans TaxID=666685 RepID=A0A368KAK5_9GAMM|nr:energy transducer TonB [Rhodanobacter denitrificans]RCS28969.1 energy transducer TonB [Rhodanobacter denitrificans]
MKTSFHPLGQGLLLALLLGSAAPALAQARKVDQQNLYRYWILLNTQVKMDVPNSGLNLDKPGCAAVTYTVGSDGVPMDVQVVKLAPKSDLGPVARSAVSNFRYGPSLTNRISEPVATYYIVPFNAPADPAQRQQLLDACKLSGYGG